jgi:hypothetical protein
LESRRQGGAGSGSISIPLLSARWLVPIAVVVLAWGGVHLLSSHNLAVTPAVWPAAATPSSGPAGASAVPPPSTALGPSPTPAPGNGAAIPILPGALQQLNRSTRDTAVGLNGLIQQLEEALRSRLEQLANQLEPGR